MDSVPDYGGDSIWLRRGKYGRADKGQVQQTIDIVVMHDIPRAQPIEIFLRFSSLGSFDGKGAGDIAFWQEMTVNPNTAGEYSFDIFTDGYFRVDVWAKKLAGTIPHWAMTAFNLYGALAEAPVPDDASPAPGIATPAFALSSDGESYWPQTGQEFTFRPAWPGADDLREMEVRGEDGMLLASLLRDGDGGFRYRPPHDEALDRAGDSATKNFIFVGSGTEGFGTVSYSLAVHRSRKGRSDLPVGLTLLAFSMVVSTGAALWFRRTRRPR